MRTMGKPATYRKGNQVRRYHVENLIVQETNGHHHANVAMLCYFLTEGRCSKELLLAALTHDMPEQYLGDPPHPAKRDNGDLERIYREASSKWLSENSMVVPITENEWRILKAADYLDACLKALEEIEMGNKPMDRVLNNGISALAQLQLPQAIRQKIDVLLGLPGTGYVDQG